MAKHKRIVLAIGDSHGAAEDGWPVWLRQIIAADTFINNSQSGRTLGFDNPDERKNGLANITTYIDEGVTEAGEGLDDVVVMLGTNDCKSCFDGRLAEIEANLHKLVDRIRKHDNGGKWSPRVLIVAPPPFGKDEAMLEKYKGGAERAKNVSAVYRKVCQEVHAKFVDGHAVLGPIWEKVTKDGVHMNAEGSKRLAEEIAKQM